VSVSVGADHRLEPMRLAHLDEVLEIERSAQGTGWSRAAFAGELDQPGRCYLVALEPASDRHPTGRVVGFAGTMRIEDEVHVTTLAVAPACRRRGIASQLVVALLRAGRDAGARAATLEVRVGNVAAQALYRRLGFVPVGSRRRYYPDNGEDAIIMWLHDLDQVVLPPPGAG
jgi:[ribosomal protein S18]-alanine N-acetyltransferase